MPGGGGGGKARPPDMRLRRELRDGTVVYGDGSPKSPLGRWLRALAVFIPASLFGGLVVFCVAGSVLKGAGWKADAGWLAPPAWALAAAASFGVLLLRPARREVEPRGERRALVFRRVPLWGAPREREHRRPDVEAVALLARDHGGPYLQLKLVLADGEILFVEHGKEMERMRELARDVGQALGLPVTFFPAPAPGMAFGRRLTRLTLASGEVRWVDFDYRSSLVGTWAACIACGLLSGVAALGLAYAIGSRWSGRTDVPALDYVVLTLLLTAGSVVFGASVVSLWRPRYRGVRLPPKGDGVVLQRLGRFGRRWDETMPPGAAAAVVLVRDRKGAARQLWLERPGGERRYLDGGGDGEGLVRLAGDLVGRLRVPLRRENRTFFLL